MADENLRMTATVADKATGPLRGIQRELRNFGQQSAPLRRELDALKQTTDKIVPGFARMSSEVTGLARGTGTYVGAVAALGAAAGLAVVKLGDFAKRVTELRYLSQETGLAAKELKTFELVARRFNIEPDRATQSLSRFARAMTEIKARAPGGPQEWMFQQGLGDLAGQLETAPDRAEALKRALQGIEDVRKKFPGVEGEQRARILAEQLFGDANIARMRNYGEVAAKVMKDFPDLEAQIKAARDLKEAIDDLGDAWEKLSTGAGTKIIPYLTKFVHEIDLGIKESIMLIEDVEKLIEKLGGLLPNNPLNPANRTGEQQMKIDDKRRQLGAVEGLMQGVDKESAAYRRLDERREELERSIRLLEDGMKKLQKAIDDAADPLKKMNFTPGGDDGGGMIRLGGPRGSGIMVPGGAQRTSLGGGGGGIGGGLGGGGGGVGPTGEGAGGAAERGLAVPKLGSAQKTAVAAGIASQFRDAGMSEQGIAGLLGNVQQESGFNPNLRHADQPRFSGEAHYAHGLYQEGGTEWNKFDAWLKQNHQGADWRDPKLQTEFLIQNLQKNYPKVWNQMKNAKSPEEAAHAFMGGAGWGYLRPAAWAANAAGRQAAARRFFQSMPQDVAATARGKMDTALDKEVNHTVEGSGQITVDVNAPRGTRVSGQSDGIFKRLKMNRQTQMEPADAGPTEGSP